MDIPGHESREWSELVEGKKVIFPLRIDDIENDAAFEPSNEVGSKLFFFFLVTRGDSFDGGVAEFVVA